MEVWDNRIPLRDLALPVLLTSLVVAMHRAFSKYRSYVPDALLSESKTTQNIYRMGRLGWQLALARQMLSERIQNVEATLNRVAEGAEFIKPRRMSSDDYFGWLQDRPETLQRLVHSVTVQCISELPKVIGRCRTEEQLSELKLGIHALAELYQYARDFEVKCHQIVPPDMFRDVHEMTHGWTKPIRDGIGKFMEILEQLSSLDKKTIKEGTASLPQFDIVFDSPKNIDEFCERINAINASNPSYCSFSGNSNPRPAGREGIAVGPKRRHVGARVKPIT